MHSILQRICESVKENRANLSILAVYAFLLLFFCSQMSPLYPINEWCDVNVYFNVGKCIFEGRTLYTEAFDHKGPLIFFIYGFGYLISHTSFFGVFLIQFVAWVVVLYAAYYTAKLYLGKSLSVISAFVFPLFLFRYFEYGGAPEEFILVFEVVSLYFFVRYFKNKAASVHSPRIMLLHGVLSGMAFFIKLNLILFWFFPLAILFLNLLMHKEYRNFVFNLTAYVGGLLVVALPLVLYLYFNDALYQAYYVYVVTNSKYASFPPTVVEAVSLLAQRIYLLMRNDMLGAVVIAIGMFYFPVRYINNKMGRAAFILCGISLFLITSATRSFFVYYNLPLCMFLILGWIAIFACIQCYVTVGSSQKLVYASFAVLVLLGVTQKQFYGVGGEVFFDKKKAEGVIFRFSDEIQKTPNPTLLNLGFGDANAIFTHCGIVPNVTYFVTPNIPYDLYPELRDEQTKYIEDRKVEFIVFTNVSMNHDYFENLPAFKQNYELIDTYVDTRYYFDIEQFFYTYYLYKRKSL